MKDSLHRMLKRQLARIYGKSFDQEQLSENERQLIQLVSSTYEENDREQRFTEHTLSLNSSELNKKNQALSKVLRSLADAQRLSKTGSWNFELNTGKLEWSDEVYRILELSPQSVPPSFDLARTLVAEEDLERADVDLHKTLSTGGLDETYRLRLQSGKIKFIHEQRAVITAGNSVAAIQGTLQDVTAQKSAEQELHLYADVFRNSGEAILISDRNNRIVAVNDAFTRTTGYTIDDLRGKDPHVLSTGETPREVYETMWSALKARGYWQGELTDRRKDGSTYPKWISISVSHDESGRVMNYVASSSDITESKETQHRVQYLAHHDSLTDLLNRFSFEERLVQALNTARRNGQHLALMFIDMDRFKSINDTHGHQAGDALLVEVGKRLRTSVRECDIIARIGGDEFVVAVTSLHDDAQVAPIARIILHMLGQPYAINQKEIYSSPSIGISTFPYDGNDAETLMLNADTAMYHAKAQGRNNFQFFTESMTVDANQRLKLEMELREAIELNQFELHYQPQICCQSMAPVAVETLVRWRHPAMGLVSPGMFIPLAEETKLIVPIGNWVLEEACRKHQEWRLKYNRRIRMAVNLSAQQLLVEDLVERVDGLLGKYGMSGEDLELEVTESAAMNKPEDAIKLLKRVRKLGVELAIDDFGTGYSSLAYLKLLPIQTLKLDRAFVSDIESNENGAAISAATLALAHNLNLKVVAEGVETETQRDFLLGHKCDYLQGYLFSKPLPPDEAIEFFRKYAVTP